VTVQASDTDSDAVHAVQTLLNRTGQDVAVDDDFGDQTEDAVYAPADEGPARRRHRRGPNLGGAVGRRQTPLDRPDDVKHAD
jgi:hypothetical protein